ncbi:hypothetical protein [Actinokineospora iranica]|uniref:Uncharacterized protein n=1 Tax=Actinokineospora iranica TaxID=1271860 RepID=A0A1G6J3G1_9PSEU|nr:hypothetical protein [Actinokineospora iranica]SDC13230.1 hypothetical protein SAMN05216174_101217 [Actinokineospora iranica]
MAGRGSEPTEEDGPLFREAYRQADAVDRAQTPGDRRKAMAGFAPRALVALAEGFLRDALKTGAVVFSVIVAVMAATSGDAVWAAAGIVSGVVGVGLVAVALIRHWSFGRQWAVIAVVIAVQAAYMILFWKTH